MLIPSIQELPRPANKKTGWPWTVESQEIPPRMSNGNEWPPVTVVTPSYNQAEFIEETIRSVLLQGYPNLEYIIIDGGSADGSIQIIEKYEKWISFWVSEPDAGQSDALNKGFCKAAGSIVSWLNSDDSYLPNTLVDRVLEMVGDPGLCLVYGDCQRVDENGNSLKVWKTGPVTAASLLMDGNQIPQQSTLIRASALQAVGGMDQDFHFIMDYVLWLKLSLVGRLVYHPGVVANFRKHTNSKGLSSGYKFIEEEINWLSNWDDLSKILTGAERAEMFRRKHLTAAMYAIIENKQEEAVIHLEIAFINDGFPYYNLDILEQKIIHFGSMGGQNLMDKWEYHDIFQAVMEKIKSTSLRKHLWQSISANIHIHWALRSRKTEREINSLRGHLWNGLILKPSLLFNKSVFDAIFIAMMGQGIIRSLKNFFRGKYISGFKA